MIFDDLRMPFLKVFQKGNQKGNQKVIKSKGNQKGNQKGTTATITRIYRCVPKVGFVEFKITT